MRKIHLFSPGDFAHEYGPQFVLSRLGVNAPAVSDKTTTVAGLFMPSFHPECWICVQQTEEVATVSLVTLETNLWYWGSSRRQKNYETGQEEDDTPGPAVWQETATLTRNSFDQFLSKIQSLSPEELTDTNVTSLDGMCAIGYCAMPSKPLISFEDKPNSKRAKHFEFFCLLYRLADRMLVQPRITKELAYLHGYLSLGLSFKFLISRPRTIQIFGFISIEEKAELEEALGLLSDHEPLLIDMVDFESMSTVLYPIFLQFAKRPGRTAWVATDHAREQLREIGILETSIFETVENASAWLCTIE